MVFFSKCFKLKLFLSQIVLLYGVILHVCVLGVGATTVRVSWSHL